MTIEKKNPVKKVFKTFKITCKGRVRARNDDEAWTQFKLMMLAGRVIYDIEQTN